MKVKEAIEQLSKLPPEAELIYKDPNFSGGMQDLYEVPSYLFEQYFDAVLIHIPQVDALED